MWQHLGQECTEVNTELCIVFVNTKMHIDTDIRLLQNVCEPRCMLMLMCVFVSFLADVAALGATDQGGED